MMKTALDAPLIEVPRDPALSAPKKGNPQELRSPLSVHGASRVTNCGRLSLQHAPAEDAAQIQRLVQALLAGENARVHLLGFTGTQDNGQTRMISLRVAECLATHYGFRVCVVDAEPGTADDSRPDWSLEDACSTHSRISFSHLENAGELWLLHANETAALLEPQPGSKLPKEQLLDLQRSFDYTILSAAAIQRGKSVSLLSEVQGIVLVVEAGKVRRQALENATRTIAMGDARLLGTVLTGRVLPIPERLFRWLRL